MVYPRGDHAKHHLQARSGIGRQGKGLRPRKTAAYEVASTAASRIVFAAVTGSIQFEFFRTPFNGGLVSMVDSSVCGWLLAFAGACVIAAFVPLQRMGEIGSGDYPEAINPITNCQPQVTPSDESRASSRSSNSSNEVQHAVLRDDFDWNVVRVRKAL